MQNSTQSAPWSWPVPFVWVLLVTAICQWNLAQGPNTREARFGKIQLQDALQSDEASGTDSAGTDFYEKHIKGKTVVINFFYAQCDQGVCDQVMSKLAKVQQLLGDRVGRDRFIVSITLAPTDDTPEVMKTYARGIKAKPGWSFLRGNVADIDNLRKRLGLGKVSPEFIRSLNEVSPEVEKAGKTIEAKSPTEWSPKSLRALVGDRVMWKIGGIPAGTHGLRITNWDVVKQFVEVEPVEEQWPFDATTGQSIGSTNTAGKVLVRLKIKSEPSVPTKITYNCTVQGKAMAGEVSLGQQHTGMLFAYSDRTNRHSFISFDATPTEIKETLADLEGNVAPAPAGGMTKALPEITIDAGPNVKWTSSGKSSTPAVPLKVSAKKGQTLLFRQVDTNPNRLHGIVFTTPDLVLLKTDTGTKPNAVLKQIDDFRLYNTDVAGAPNPQELARFEVTQDITTAPAFECTFHGPQMAGSVESAPAGGTTKALPEITIDAGPNVKWTSSGKSSTPAVPLKVSAKKGQTLLFRQVDTNPNRLHGIVFTTPDLVLLKTDTGTKPNAVLKQIDDFSLYNTDVPGAPNPQELARFEVTQDITTAPAFECTFHGPQMAGSVESAPAGGTTKALPEITIDAGPNVKWTSSGKSSTPAVPLKVSAKKGQTLLFRQVDTNPNRSHGIVFTTPDLVLLKTDTGTKPNAVLKQIDDFSLYNTDVPGAPNPQELARFEVTQDITTAPAFECTFHGPQMAGSVESAPAGGTTKALPETGIDAALIETPFRAMSASMQRRMLRFVNRAHVAEDLMKNPQEFRTRTEHAPAKLHEKKSDAKLGFPRAAAEALLASRPINGFREVRECLPAYQESDTLDQLRPVVESLGENQFGKWELIRGGTPSVMHAALMNNGKVVFITNSLDTCVWDPTAAPVVLPPSATKLTDILYCSGHSFLSDGKLLAVGGGGSSPGVDTSIHAWKFNPNTQEWSRTAGNMSFQRWYPTAVTLGDEPGRVLVVAGDTGNGPAPQMEVYSETTDKFEKVTVTGRNLLFAPTYPGLHLLPAGEILHVPTGFDNCNQTPSARSADPTAIFTFSSPTSGSWRILGRNQRLKGMSTLLFDTSSPFIQALVVGGGNLAKNKTAQTINLSAMTPAWSTPFPLLEERIHPNLVQLPDGTVFICGGKETNPITPPSGGRCELYNPKTGVIAEMDEMIVPRHYHSVALLLPDGRVMAAGGADDGGCTISTRNTIEVFSPPYLFKPGRPKITSATKFIEHGGTIEIKTSSAAGIGRVVLVRPMAVTHQTDSEQRVLQLSFQVTDADTIEAQAPGLETGANAIAPRGHYMLFILNHQGVPSVAKWIYLGATQVESLKANVQPDTSALKSDSDDLKLVDVNGAKRSLSEFEGRAHMLVLIRGAFCKHCASQLAEFQKRIDPAKVPVIVITPENDLADLEDIPFTVLADPELSVFRKMNALGKEPQHGTFLFDAEGKCLLENIGEEPFVDYVAIEKVLSKVFPL